MDVAFSTGSGLRRLPIETAELLANTLRAFPFEEGSREAADKIERFLVGESVDAIELDTDERRAVYEALDNLMSVPQPAAMRDLFKALDADARRDLRSRGIGPP
jgi:Arc/MetJ family transcription regulator